MLASGVVTQLTLVSADLARSVEFYTSTLGGEELYRDDAYAVVRLAGTVVFLLVEREARVLVAPAELGDPGGRRTVVTVEVDGVDATAEALAAAGVPLLNGPLTRPWGTRSATFCDPDGYVWEIAQPG